MDPIDREKLLSTIAEHERDSTAPIDYVGIIKSMPTVELKQQWIPCSERLPEKRTEVLVTRTFEGYKKFKPRTYVEIAELLRDEWIAVSDEFKFGRHTDPVAWCELPKPYREEGGE